jgi:hypothetical protein
MRPPIYTREIDPSNDNDWTIGLRDAHNKVFPRYPANQSYMNGWLQELGMEAGYDNTLPISNDNYYMEGYDIAQFERQCHKPDVPDIRTL